MLGFRVLGFRAGLGFKGLLKRGLLYNISIRDTVRGYRKGHYNVAMRVGSVFRPA